MCWHSSGLRFVSGHKDGTVTQWRVNTEEEEEQSHLIVRKKYFGTWSVCACVGVQMISNTSDPVVLQIGSSWLRVFDDG